MTTTLRPTAPLQQGVDGARSRTYDVCVNSRPVGRVELSTDVRFGGGVGRIAALGINEADRRRGRATVAALAAEEVLRGWGCRRVEISVPAEAAAARRMADGLGYTERGRIMTKALPAGPPALPAGVVGRPMSAAEFDAWLPHTKAGYAESLTARGYSEDAARAKSDADHATALADGIATPDTYLGVLVRDGAVVGTLWLALRNPHAGASGAYVFDVEVAGAYRGQGLGRALLLLAEREAMAAGAERIGLNVYADNTPARRLYESLGYEPVSYNLYKHLL
ncbi:GNAT family N-acetyltransferase [Streptomyces agglomeratus]|uniref:GNAT family N-acetyltransferase n=1 Tax=Streptomyces agglomeratus TaxID=285458 RepID=A0A1E5PE39_9ACTN|nr:GNAT family N-acetyltransferase [Streptomyces agglomeratus]OEJ27802.1 GNAT family N-acetyltransferase [Streptomyces agglomeratus]OEJ38138.1 GNAT family N-acetyltransferase [Streptomyces agglomeratus]OEJ47478.1 GNAT family N-acetyltransferase [Streptomyces agglomeratus]OEJ50665.1 GNAT family N-acetyltransferase [Streptomyces agglomeratus]OEJ58027.1 GNAT family N-acetyltransferase [Streptomyces agglomeratus]